MPDVKKVVFHADDFGWSPGINEGIVDSHRHGILTSTSVIATMPGLAIFTVSLAFNLLGDGLRDVLDPKDSTS